MAVKRVDLLNQPKVHRPAEVERAAAELSLANLKRLRAIAHVIMRRYGVDVAGRDYDDLVSEALARTLNGTRSWRKGVDFMHHLTQSMRSIAWRWFEREAEKRAAAAARPWEHQQLAPANDDDAAVAERVIAPQPDVERAAIARERLRKITGAFADDPEAKAVLAGWAIGCKGPEIRRRYGMTEKQLRAAVRRIRRFAQQGIRYD